MKVLIVGSGGREHALAWKCAQTADEVLVAPGNAGTARERGVRNVPVGSDDIDGLIELAKAEGVGLFWILARPDLSGRFDKVIEVEGRRIVRQGPPEDPPGARAAPASPEPRQAPGREEGVRLR